MEMRVRTNGGYQLLFLSTIPMTTIEGCLIFFEFLEAKPCWQDRVAEYVALLQAEHKLRVEVIETQNPALEEERIKLTLLRERLLFELDPEELVQVRGRMSV